MSLYYEAAAVLSNSERAGGSLKSRLYNQKDLKSSPAQLFALISETSKWSAVLKDVIEKCGLLGAERKLTPTLALLLTHDLLLTKSGVAANANHVLKLAILRHKARLGAEFTKERIRHGYASLKAFSDAVKDGVLEGNGEDAHSSSRHPRWVRVNTLKTSLAEQLSTTFAAYVEVESLSRVTSAAGSAKIYFKDLHIPNLLALPPRIDLSKSPAYTKGDIIFQDKASCFPAYLLNIELDDGDIIDGCAAPGNKTTHLAATVSEQNANRQQKIIAFERDKARAGTLQKMVKLASADRLVTVKAGADFLAAVPDSDEFSSVGAILLDPSCSGSGIVGRDDAVQMYLPVAPSASISSSKDKRAKKRKRETEANNTTDQRTTLSLALDESTPEETPMEGKVAERLIALSAFQLRILIHAMRFPKARKITYSTCSLHIEENEGVVTRALGSPAAKEGGWTVLKREHQVEGIKKWSKRGMWDSAKLEAEDGIRSGEEAEDIIDACVRCEKGTEEGTMGFFVAAFVRGLSPEGDVTSDDIVGSETAEEWNGFGDEEGAASNDIAQVVQPTASKRTKKKRKQGHIN